MKKIIIPFVLFICALAVSLADDDVDYAKVNPATITKAINKLLADPLSKDSKGYSAIIVKYAEASPDIKISISVGLMPWLEIDGLPDEAMLLMSV